LKDKRNVSSEREPKIVNVDQLDNGAVISFEDGRSGFYSAALLSEVFPRARNIHAEAEREGAGLPQ
jgi:hypothetical protein